jgi:hypothetical protein
MKKLFALLFGLMMLSSIVSCDSETADQIAALLLNTYQWETLAPNTSPDVDITTIPTVFTSMTVTSVYKDTQYYDGYSLDQNDFVSKNTINTSESTLDQALYDGRSLYTYESYSGSFSPRKTSSAPYYYDLRWEEFITGYYLPTITADKPFYFPSEDIPSRFDCKNPTGIRMYRTVYVKDGYTYTIVQVKGVASLTKDILQNGTTTYSSQTVYLLSSFITAKVTSSPANYTYKLTPIDGDTYAKTLTWTQMQGAYFWPRSAKAALVIYPTDPSAATLSIIGSESTKWLKTIELIAL